MKNETNVYWRAWPAGLLLALAGLGLWAGDAGMAPAQGAASFVSNGGARAQEEVPIRVSLVEDKQIWVDSRGGSGLAVWDPAERKVLLHRQVGQGLWFSRPLGQWQATESAGRRLLPDGRASGKKLEIHPLGDGVLTVDESGEERGYRGMLQLVARGSDRLVAVNVVGMEDYLAGVVGSEMPASWKSEALRAQAIACRTYALYEMHSKQGRPEWDLDNTQQSQVYGGVANEHSRVKAALRDTRGVVLVFGPEGREKIFPTFFSATCGGHTQKSTALIEESLLPLKGQACAYCRPSASNYRWGAVTSSKKEVSRKLLERIGRLADLQEVVDIKVIAASDYGRLETLQLVGRNGQRQEIMAEVFRQAISTREKPVRSSWFQLVDAGTHWRFDDGRGWGHGVGLCQYGSQGMARAGRDCVEILQYYYPKTLLVRAY